jgi:hypothetical protein
VINFRYHVVSLTAVFFALAIGLIVGTAALNGPAADELHHQVTNLSDSNGVLRARVNSLTAEVNNREQFVTAIAPQLLAGKLTNRRVLVVSMPGSTKYVTGVDTSLKLAGAKITGHVEIQDKFVDPSNNADLLDLATKSLTSAEISGLPTNSDGVETASALLAAVLMDRVPVVTAQPRQTVIAGFVSDKYISADSATITNPAEAVVFVAPQPFEDSNASNENQDLVTIVGQLEIAGPGPVVVAAAGAAGSGNLIGAVTGDASLSKTVSTVDNIDTAEGQVAVALALNEQLVYNKSGHYGSSASTLLPKWPEE